MLSEASSIRKGMSSSHSKTWKSHFSKESDVVGVDDLQDYYKDEYGRHEEES